MRSLTLVAAVWLLACDARETRLGSWPLPGPADAGAGPIDAGPTLGRADAVGSLSLERCIGQVAPQLPLFTCVGASTPPQFQCVVSVAVDGGVSVVRQLPSSGTRVIERLHGLAGEAVVAEVADSAPAGVRTLELFPAAVPGLERALLTRPGGAPLSGVAVSVDAVDLLSCSGLRCALETLPLDGGAVVVLDADVPTAATGPILRTAGGVRAWADDGGVTRWTPGGGRVRVQAPGVARAALADDGAVYFLSGAALERLAADGARAQLAQGLDAPHAVFAIGGYAVVVERRAVRAFPAGGGGALVLYELPAAASGALGNARLVQRRLVFDQVCGAFSGRPVTGRVELDPARARARWLNDDARWPFVPGASAGAHPLSPTLREVLTSDGVLVGVVD
ncbi:MAG: hypothetical protein INH41_30955 [Myxococcaceae bacterium]|nr:hypothetical protein [Myxococcaceae bacterium]MCA3016826.1 hypothetical protein [Myxococcaceae bacterium]